ncbi:hypothetical protein BDC45DRAFT_316164 [Circinella umbellata]|nr:hypothetical protein BDC45DRAFT_316164 [Circinella umbellata]
MTRTLLLKSSSRSTNIIEKYLDDVNHYEWNTCDLLEELVKFIEIVNDESDLHLFKKLYIKALDQIIMKTDNESRRKRAVDIKTAIDQVLKHSTFLKILTDSSRVNKRTRSSLTPSTSTSTHIEKKKLKRRMSFNIGPIMDNACCNIATAMNKKKLLFLYLKKPKEILNADWRTVQNYIMKHARPVCLSIEEQNALNYIRKCRTLDELTKCRHDLFDPNQKSDGVCYIRGALDRIWYLFSHFLGLN